jgi:hypothetical protein
MATSREKLQDIKNRLVTAHVGWQAFAEACVPAYEEALKIHKKALSDSKTNTELQAKQLWQVFSFALQAFVGPWAPRLLAPITEKANTVKVYMQGRFWVVDELSAAWTHQAFSGLHDPAKELAKSIKDTAVEKAKSMAVKMSDAFEPIAEETLIYTARLKEGIHTRGKLLMAMIDELIERSDTIPVAQATSLFNGYVNNCSFLTDVPGDVGDVFKIRFKAEAELAMWVAWAVARDENHWRWAQQTYGAFGSNFHAQPERSAMDPIRLRLIALSVPEGEFSSTESMYAGGYKWEGIDMVKLIQWGKKMSKPKDVLVSPAKEVCRQVDPNWLKIRQNPNACYVGA